jgi:hypothetical protein
MIWIEARCTFWGETFSPRVASELTSLSFAEKNERGEIAVAGRYKGQALPYGSSTLLPPQQLTPNNAYFGIEWLAGVLARHQGAFESAGASQFVLRIDVYHDGQCNLEFTPSLIQKLAGSPAPVALSCYEDSEHVNRSLEDAKKALA